MIFDRTLPPSRVSWAIPMRVAAVIFLAAMATRADIRVGVGAGGVPEIRTNRTEHPPVIDGLLDDMAWEAAPLLDDFWGHDLHRAPTERTSVGLAYDSVYIYLAARCYDGDPSSLRMEEAKRGGDITNDDHITFELDISHQHRTEGVWRLAVTPRGTQWEDVPDGSAPKIEWRGDWHARARVDSLGWTVEAAVPLALFNKAEGEQTIGVSVARWHDRTKEEARWPNMGDSWDRKRTANWTGIQWPRIPRRPLLMPYAVAGRQREEVVDGSKRWENLGYLGLDAKYQSATGFTILGTVNPDTRNVESEVLDLDFSYVERRRTENRPFFAEGAEYFAGPAYFYSQRVGDVYGGVKAFGLVGNNRIGVLDVVDRDRVNHLAYSWWSEPLPRFEVHQLGFWRTGPSDVPGPIGLPPAENALLYSADVTARRQTRGTEELWYVQTRLSRASGDSITGDFGDGYTIEGGWQQFSRSRIPGIYLVYRQTGENYAPYDALHFSHTSGTREVYTYLDYFYELDGETIRSVGFDGEGRYAHFIDGGLSERFIYVFPWVQTRSDCRLQIGLFAHERKFDTGDIMFRDRGFQSEFLWNTNSLYINGSVGGLVARRDDARYYQLEFSQGLRPWEALSFAGQAAWVRWDYPVGHAADSTGGTRDEHQVRGSVQWDITTEMSVSGRLIRSTDYWNGYVSFRRAVRRGADVYVIVGDPAGEKWRPRAVLKVVVVL